MALSLTNFMVVLDTTIANVSVPHIAIGADRHRFSGSDQSKFFHSLAKVSLARSVTER